MSETENPNLDDMTFGEAFARCRTNRRVLMRWRGSTYNISNANDVAAGVRRQADIYRERRAMSKNMADAMTYGMDMTRTRIDPKDFYMGVDMAKPEDPDFAEIDAPIIGRMITDKRVDLLRIERQANGGWLVDGRKDVRDDYITRSDVSAAFTNTADMLRALADLLERDDEKRKEAQDG